jgi:plastocyanin
MKRAVLVLAATSLLALAVPAQAATRSVAIGDNFFNSTTSSTTTILRGDSVQWKNGGFSGHTTTGDSPLGYWGSPTLGHNVTYTTPLTLSAGTYPYHCKIHSGMKGMIKVPVGLTRSVRKITIALNTTTAPTGYKYVVQRKNGTGYVTIGTVTTPSFVFNAPAAGTYTFRAALQRNTTTAPAAFFSAPAAISVS